MSDIEQDVNVAGILAWAAIHAVHLPFSVGIVEGQTRIGAGWPLRFTATEDGDLRIINCGSIGAVMIVGDGRFFISPGGGTMTIIPTGFAGDAP